jgi:hypothetical protein
VKREAPPETAKVQKAPEREGRREGGTKAPAKAKERSTPERSAGKSKSPKKPGK